MLSKEIEIFHSISFNNLADLWARSLINDSMRVGIISSFRRIHFAVSVRILLIIILLYKLDTRMGQIPLRDRAN